MRSLLILGPGFTAKVLADLAAAAGWDVKTAGRSSIGYQHVEWDALKEPSFAPLITPETVVVYSVPTLFRTVEAGDPHLAPVKRVIEVCEQENAQSLIYLSSTAVYGNRDGEWIDESSERHPTSPFGIMRSQIEDLVLDAAFGYVVRIVGIYGPGRTLVEAFDRGRYKLVGGGEKVSNRIHVDDLAAIIFEVAKQQPNEKVFLATDGSPIRVRELVDWLQENVGVEPPESVSLETYEADRGKNNADRWRNTIKCSNRRVVEVLGYEYKHPDVIAGYRSIFENTLDQ